MLASTIAALWPTWSSTVPATIATPAAKLVLPTPPLREPITTIVDPRSAIAMARSWSELGAKLLRKPLRFPRIGIENRGNFIADLVTCCGGGDQGVTGTGCIPP